MNIVKPILSFLITTPAYAKLPFEGCSEFGTLCLPEPPTKIDLLFRITYSLLGLFTCFTFLVIIIGIIMLVKDRNNQEKKIKAKKIIKIEIILFIIFFILSILAELLGPYLYNYIH